MSCPIGTVDGAPSPIVGRESHRLLEKSLNRRATSHCARRSPPCAAGRLACLRRRDRLGAANVSGGFGLAWELSGERSSAQQTNLGQCQAGTHGSLESGGKQPQAHQAPARPTQDQWRRHRRSWTLRATCVCRRVSAGQRKLNPTRVYDRAHTLTVRHGQTLVHTILLLLARLSRRGPVVTVS